MTAKPGAESYQPGIAVDKAGDGTIDPSVNVAKLNEASSKRQDDLRDSAKELWEAKFAHIKEISDLRAVHAAQLAKAEADRLDSIRQVDREDVNKTAAQALVAIQTLAQTTNATAETLRTQVATTAAAALSQLTLATAETNKRLSALELSSSEGKGGRAVADPALDKLVNRMEDLLKASALGEGQSKGISMATAVVVGAVMVASALIGIAGFFLARN